ncbi:hypothetical protein EGW08_023797 [Elysia chlorotica]|uniref:Uncharacterized protein n=1 Tax=Elysia chlorotica TaxID=188477 RepID=A0A433SI14_ELYCH|nr:hypothetical protein EGW08_023797 [Elysia chlorotica]
MLKCLSKGQPAYEQYETDPDWIPSVKMGHDMKRNVAASSSKHYRAEGRKKRKKDIEAATSLLELSASDIQVLVDENTPLTAERLFVLVLIRFACSAKTFSS